MTQILVESNNRRYNQNNQPAGLIKFLYSYGGKIIPRRSDGELRYIGGHTRVLSIERSVSFAELMIKFGELCGESMNLRCKLPREDLDVMVSIKSDEDLRNVVEEYENFSLSVQEDTKIRAILAPSNSIKKVASPPSSPMSCFDFPLAGPPNLKSPLVYAAANRFYPAPVWRNGDFRGGLRRYQKQL